MWFNDTRDTHTKWGSNRGFLKILNGCEHIDSIFFFSKFMACKIIGGHNITLVNEQSRLDVSKYSFLQRNITLWDNYLLMVCTRIDEYIIKAGCT